MTVCPYSLYICTAYVRSGVFQQKEMRASYRHTRQTQARSHAPGAARHRITRAARHVRPAAGRRSYAFESFILYDLENEDISYRKRAFQNETATGDSLDQKRNFS